MYVKRYPLFVLAGFVGLIWFFAIAKGGHDLWAATVAYGILTLLGILFCAGRWLDGRPIRLPLLGPALAVVISACLSQLHSFDVSTTAFEIRNLLFLAGCYYLLVNLLEDPAVRDRFYVASGLILIPLALISLWQRATEKPWAGEGHVMLHLGMGSHGVTLPISYGHWEIHATLVNSIVLAGFVLFWVVYTAPFHKRSRLSTTVFVAAIVALLVANSWAAFIAATFGVTFSLRTRISAYATSHKARIRLMVLLLIGVSAAAIWIKLHQSKGGLSYAASDRLHFWITAWNAWLANPLTGVGLGAYPVAFPWYKAAQTQNTLFAHSLALQWLAETGLAGLVAVFSGIVPLVQHVRATSKQPVPRHAALLGTLLAVLAYSLLNINMEFLINKLMLVVVISLLTASDDAHRLTPGAIWWGCGIAALVLIIPLWYSPFMAGRLYVNATLLEREGNLVAAERTYLDALALEPANGDCWYGLARLSAKRFEHSRSPEAQHQLRERLKKAVQYKRDVRMAAQVSRDMDAVRTVR